MIIEIERTDNVPMMLNWSHVISVEPTSDPHVPVRIHCSDGTSYEIKNSYGWGASRLTTKPVQRVVGKSIPSFAKWASREWRAQRSDFSETSSYDLASSSSNVLAPSA